MTMPSLETFKSIYVELTNLCNLRCKVCPTGYGYFDDKSRGVLEFKQFKNIVDPIKKNIDFVLLSGYGEPMLAPSISKITNFLGRNCIACRIYTNGTVISNDMLIC